MVVPDSRMIKEVGWSTKELQKEATLLGFVLKSSNKHFKYYHPRYKVTVNISFVTKKVPNNTIKVFRDIERKERERIKKESGAVMTSVTDKPKTGRNIITPVLEPKKDKEYWLKWLIGTREEAKATQKIVAELMGVTNQSIWCAVEKGRRGLSSDELKRYCELVGVPVPNDFPVITNPKALAIMGRYLRKKTAEEDGSTPIVFVDPVDENRCWKTAAEASVVMVEDPEGAAPIKLEYEIQGDPQKKLTSQINQLFVEAGVPEAKLAKLELLIKAAILLVLE